MSEHEAITRRDRGAPGPEEREVRRLIESAGRRPEVPAADLAAIRAAARVEWTRKVESRASVWRSLAPLALAASLILALVAGWWWMRPAPPAGSATVATVERLAGEARAAGARATVGQALAGGSELETPPEAAAGTSLLAIRLDGGPSVRLDAGSRLRLLSGHRLELTRGAVYVDSRPGARAVEIATPLGDVLEIGTQFEVRLANGEGRRLRVRVREGSVSIRRAGGSLSAGRGEEVTIYRDGSVRRDTVPVAGPQWSWILAAAPALEIEGLPLAAYLDWLSRETGWRVRFEGGAGAELTASTRLHGTIEGLSPDQSLEVVMAGSNLDWRLEGDELWIGPVRTPG